MIRRMGPFPGIPVAPRPAYSGPMPTLCGIAGPLPEDLRRFVDQDGELRAGDAVGLEAAWILSVVDHSTTLGNYVPEDEYNALECEATRQSSGTCVQCGAEDVDTEDCECWDCRRFAPPVSSELAPFGWTGWAS